MENTEHLVDRNNFTTWANEHKWFMFYSKTYSTGQYSELYLTPSGVALCVNFWKDDKIKNVESGY
jgi:hypothetical protein